MTTVVFDLETTGTDVKKDRIVQLGGVVLREDGQPPQSFLFYVDPEMGISEGAQKVHGITPELLEKKGAKPFKDQIELIDSIFRHGYDLGGYNILGFDLPILKVEYERCGFELSMEGVRIYDSLEIFKRFERRRLEDAYRFYCGKELQGAHDALVDAKATVEVLQAQRLLYDGSELAADPFEGKLVPNEDGDLCFGFGKHEGKVLQEVASVGHSYLSWVCNSDFPLAVQQAVEDAQRGKLQKVAPPPALPPSRFSIPAFQILEKSNRRLKELYSSTLEVIRRYQQERDSLLKRVESALLAITEVSRKE